MANRINGTDNTITIDTELDSTGFDRGSDKLLKAVEGLIGSIDSLARSVMKSLWGVSPV